MDVIEQYRQGNPIVNILTAPDVPPEWLVKDMFLQGTLVCLAGSPGSGKSYISYTLGLAVAAGVPALSGLVPAATPKRVLYFDQENSRQDRDKYLCRSYVGLTDANGAAPDLEVLRDNFWPCYFHLGDADWEDRAAECIEFVRPHLIVFDTATPCFNLQDENDNAEATRAGQALHRLMDLVSPKATAIVLRHEKLKTERGSRRTMRGAKAWHSQADAILFQVKQPGRPRKSSLSLTRLVPDKTRAYGLRQTVYITPKWTDAERSGLRLDGSYDPDEEHKEAEDADEGE